MIKIIKTQLILLLLSSSLYAVDLMEAVTFSLNNNNTYKANMEKFKSDYIYKGMAKTALLPQIDLSSSLNNTKMAHSGDNYTTLSLSINQPLFDYSAWAYYSKAKLMADRAAIQLKKDTNDIILQTVNQYFVFLSAIDDLDFARAKKESIKSQMDMVIAQVKVGKSRLSDIDEVKASYEASNYQVIQAQNSLEVEKDKLENMLGQKVDSYSKVVDFLSKENIAIDSSLDSWLDNVKKANLDLLYYRINILIADEDISAKDSSFYPNIYLFGSYNYNNQESSYLTTENKKSGTIGLNLNMNLFAGGRDKKEKTQLMHNKKEIEYSLNDMELQVSNSTKEYYLAVKNGNIELKSLEQSLISSEKSLKEMRVSYKLGLRTNTDILGAMQNYYDVKKNYSSAKYRFLLSILSLKAVSGELKIDDIKEINHYLK